MAAAQVEKHLEDWIEAQIVKIDDKKWGSKVSQKLFVDKAFVVKHIRNKHPLLLQAERDQVWCCRRHIAWPLLPQACVH